MNFTREPVVETVISPQEGSKLVLRPTHTTASKESYRLEAVEIVSFGTVSFFRSIEPPHEFLLPLSDYILVEEKEARLGLKKPRSSKPASRSAPKKDGVGFIQADTTLSLDQESPPEVASKGRSKKTATSNTSSSKRARGSTSSAKANRTESTSPSARPSTQESQGTPASTPPVKRSLLPPPPLLVRPTQQEGDQSIGAEQGEGEQLQQGAEGQESPPAPLPAEASVEQENLTAAAHAASSGSDQSSAPDKGDTQETDGP